MEDRFALLIDADNVSAKYIKPILDELSKYGNVTYKRIYGDWTKSNSASWKEELLQNSITPIQQFSYTQGKNSTDSAMIIDAMDMLYTSELEGFCLVSSDSDFTKLASRLRESGKMVIGMGEDKTPLPFRKACDIFTVLEVLLEDNTIEKEESEGKFYHPHHLPPLKDGDILLNGHTHIPACEEILDMNGGTYQYLNPGSVSIPKEGSEHSYMIYENGTFAWKNLTGEEYQTWKTVSHS